MAAAVVATLAMGIGANTAIFSAVDAVLLKPLPYPDADRLVAVYELNQGLKQATQLVAPVRLESWNRENRTLAGLAGSYFENQTDTTGATPERVESMRISPRFFAVLGVGAALGRTPTADEDRFGGPAVVVVSDAFWRRRFDADPRAVGSALIFLFAIPALWFVVVAAAVVGLFIAALLTIFHHNHKSEIEQLILKI